MNFDSADDFFDSQLLLHILKKFQKTISELIYIH